MKLVKLENMTYALAGGTGVPSGACGYKSISIKGGWPGKIQSRKMVDRFKFTNLRTYMASQCSYTDGTSAPRVCILMGIVMVRCRRLPATAHYRL